MTETQLMTSLPSRCVDPALKRALQNNMKSVESLNERSQRVSALRR